MDPMISLRTSLAASMSPPNGVIDRPREMFEPMASPNPCQVRSSDAASARGARKSTNASASSSLSCRLSPSTLDPRSSKESTTSCDDPATSPRSRAAVSRSSANSASPRSSACVPNSAVAVCARSAGSSMPRSPSSVSCSADDAVSPPAPTRCAMSSADAPMAANPAAVVSDPSTARMLNSFSASAALSLSRAPASMAWLMSPSASGPSSPRSRNSVEYSLNVSRRSSALFAGPCNPAVMRSNASVESLTSPVRISCAAALIDCRRSWSNTCDVARAAVATCSSSASDRSPTPAKFCCTSVMASPT